MRQIQTRCDHVVGFLKNIFEKSKTFFLGKTYPSSLLTRLLAVAVAGNYDDDGG